MRAAGERQNPSLQRLDSLRSCSSRERFNSAEVSPDDKKIRERHRPPMSGNGLSSSGNSPFYEKKAARGQATEWPTGWRRKGSGPKGGDFERGSESPSGRGKGPGGFACSSPD